MVRKSNKLQPLHPGHYLREEFLKPLGMNANQLAQCLHVPAGRITQILNGERAITADTALRLSYYFGTTPQYWMNAQTQYELELAEDELAGKIAESIQPYKYKLENVKIKSKN